MLYRQQSRKQKLSTTPEIRLTLLTMRDNSRSLREVIRSTLNDPGVNLPFNTRLELNKSIQYLDDVYMLLNRLRSEI